MVEPRGTETAEVEDEVEVDEEKRERERERERERREMTNLDKEQAKTGRDGETDRLQQHSIGHRLQLTKKSNNTEILSSATTLPLRTLTRAACQKHSTTREERAGQSRQPSRLALGGVSAIHPAQQP
ncbi:hypothetical protein PABG_11541 [Paracoccidioides brasiliensis Pb03]|nr:hypothetical protein PABG_11541 [Paracoccidioides brasiliensis Pb03]